MRFLDWIKGGGSAQQQLLAANSSPETAKQKGTREAIEQQASYKPLDQLPRDKEQELSAIRERFVKATQDLGQQPTAPSPGPEDSGSPETLRQNASGQDKTAHVLSPTTEQTGKTALEITTSVKAADTSPEIQRQTSRAKPHTLPRPKPSWER